MPTIQQLVRKGRTAPQKALVEQRAAGADLVHLGERLDHRRGAVAVGALGGRGAV